MAGKNYNCTCKFNDAPEGGWVLDFADSETNTSIIANLPLITGRNIFDGLDYLEFGCSLYVYTDGNAEAVPTYENLGIESNVYLQVLD